MILNDVKNIMIGDVKVSKVYRGNTIVFDGDTSPLPEGYTKLNYIQSSGEQWISLSMDDPQLTDMIQIQTKFAFTSIGSNTQAIVSVDNYHTGSVYATYCLYFGASSSGFYVQTSNPAGSSATDASPSIVPEANVDYEADITVGASETGVAVDGTRFVSTINHGIQHGLMMFANRASAAYPYSSFASMKMYYCRIYINGILTRELFPCIRDDDSKIGMYDIITQTFRTNSGSGSDFIGG